MAITSLRFFKGAFAEGTNYVDGGIYFDKTSRQIRVGKGGADSFDAFGGAVKDVTFVEGELTISFLDGRTDVVVDLATVEGIITALADRVGNVEDQVTDLKVVVGSPAIEGQPATGLFKKVEEAQTTADTAAATATVAQTTADSALTKATSAYELADSKVTSITVGATLSNTGTAKEPVLGVKISDKTGNKLSVEDDGLYVTAADQTDYTVSVTSSTVVGLAKKYILSQCGETIGEIDIPKDMVVSSGTVRKPTAEEAEEYGVDVDENYIVLTLANVEEHPLIFIPTTDLIQIYTSGSQVGDPVTITVSSDHKISATLGNGVITLAHLNSDLQDAIGKAHSHTNKDVLDGITAVKIASWDAAAAKEDIKFETEYDKDTNKAATMADVNAAKPGYATTATAGIVKVGSGLVVSTTDGTIGVDSDTYKVKDLAEGTGIGITITEAGKHEVSVKIDNDTIKTDLEGKLYVDASVIADVPIATADKTGVVRGGGDIKVDASGDMWMSWDLYD